MSGFFKPGTSKADQIAYFKRRLACAKRRLRYWSGNPSFSAYRPTGKSLQRAEMSGKYELAVNDCHSLAGHLDDLGVKVRVVDVRRTFQCRWTNPKHPEVLIWPESK